MGNDQSNHVVIDPIVPEAGSPKIIRKFTHDLPDELWSQILIHLSLVELSRFARVSRRGRKLTRIDSIWARHFWEQLRIEPQPHCVSYRKELKKYFEKPKTPPQPIKSNSSCCGGGNAQALEKNKPSEPICKVVIVGSSSIGKTCLMEVFTRGRFLETNEATVGTGFGTARIAPNASPILIQIWDTAGQERYHSLAPVYYRGSDVAIVAYSIVDRSSLDRARMWCEEVKKACQARIMIVATKLDEDSHRQVAHEAGRALAAEYSASFFECSAKTGENVMSIFETLAIIYLRDQRR